MNYYAIWQKTADIEYLTPEIHDICSIVRNCNGGAKPSGAGGGDCVVAFFENKEQKEHCRIELHRQKLSNHRLQNIKWCTYFSTGDIEMSTNTNKDTPHISSRKADHIDLCIDGDVSFKRKTTLFEEIQLIHNALPELQVSDVDLRCHFAGHTFEAPLIIAAMTGGVDRANEINQGSSECS